MKKQCTYCGTAEGLRAGLDALLWCNEHQDRRRLMDYGITQRYPALICLPFAIMEGEEGWKIAAVLGRDEMIAAALKVLDTLAA